MQISQALGVDFICSERPLSDIAAPDDHMSDTFCRPASTESFSPTCTTLHILSGGAHDITLAIYFIHIYLVNEHVLTCSFANYRKISVNREPFAVPRYYLGLPNLSTGSVSRCSLMPPPVQKLLAVNVINSMSLYNLFCFPSC